MFAVASDLIARSWPNQPTLLVVGIALLCPGGGNVEGKIFEGKESIGTLCGEELGHFCAVSQALNRAPSPVHVVGTEAACA